MRKPEITIGIPCHSGAEDLLPWCLQGIRDRSGDAIAYELVVVDDSGKDAHREKSQAVAERFGARWLCHLENRGITAGWNTLSRAAEAPLIALLNDDIIVTPGWLEALVYFLRENPGAGSVGLGFFFITAEDVPQLLASPTARVTPRHHATKIHLPAEEYAGRGTETPGCVMCPPGCAYGFTREMYELVGGIAPQTRQFYNESLPKDEFVLVRDHRGVRLTTFGQIYNEWEWTATAMPNGTTVAHPVGLECLSAVVNRDPAAAFLTVLEQRALHGQVDNREAKRRAQQKQAGAERIDGVWKPVTAISRHRRHNRVLHLSQKAGSVYVTENHSMVLPEGDGFRVVEPGVFASESLPRAIVVPLPEDGLRLDLGRYARDWDQYRESDAHIWYLGRNNQGHISEKRESPKLPRWIDLSTTDGEDLCWLLGFHVAEGSTSVPAIDPAQLHVTLASNSDTALIERAEAIWERVTGIATRRETVHKKAFPGKEYKPVVNLCVGHKLVGKLLRAMCGVGARNKRVPDFIFSAPSRCKQAFIDGYVAGDGFLVEPYSDREEALDVRRAETTSRELAAGLAILYAALGRRFSLHWRPQTESYALVGVEQFVGHRDTKKVEPTPIGDEYVYDFSVADTHVFCAGVGPVVVHNSWFGTALAAAGHPSYVIPHPVLWHIWSATFQRSGGELLADDPMTRDRAAYKAFWGGDFDYTDPLYMAPFRGEQNRREVRWLGPDGPRFAMVCA